MKLLELLKSNSKRLHVCAKCVEISAFKSFVKEAIIYLSSLVYLVLFTARVTAWRSGDWDLICCRLCGLWPLQVLLAGNLHPESIRPQEPSFFERLHQIVTVDPPGKSPFL